MKKLMVIAGGEWQVPIIRKAKQMGFSVINTNLYKESPGFEYADLGLMANVLDKEKNLEYARLYSVDAVITDQSDIAVSTVAYVADQLGLNGIGQRSASLFTNKYEMRRFCTEHGFPTPAYKLCQTRRDADDFVSGNGLPCVAKPPANQSSRGVTKITSNDQLDGAYESARRQSHDGTVLIEDFIGGTELTVDGIKLNAGEHFCLATSSKTHYAHNEMVANQLLFSRHHKDIDYEVLHRQHNSLIKLMELPFGLTHAEYKYHDGIFYLIEVAARGGGTRLSSDIVPMMSGVDSNALLIKMATGEQIYAIEPRYQDCVSTLDFFEFKAGKVIKITGIEKALELDGVTAIGLNVHEGDLIQQVDDDRSRHGYIIAHAKTENELTSILGKIRETVKVQYE